MENTDNFRYIDGKKVFNCVQCGNCCHIREKDKGISVQDEDNYRNYMFSKFGIIYLARLSDITINVWPEEAQALKKEAEKRGIKLNIAPKRAIYDKKHHELLILDFYMDHDICPFFDNKKKMCTAYEIRPIICRSYPLLSTSALGKCKHKLADPKEYDAEKFEAKQLEKMIAMQKSIISSLIANKSIEVPQTLTNIELDNILHSAKFKELRIMDKL